jgi:hypothetical protein
MKLALLGCLWFVCANNAAAHQLDEYLQATRISVTTNRIDLATDLTPGVAIVAQLLAEIDKNHDGQMGKEEVAAYAQSFLKDIRITLDEKVLAPRLVAASFPTLFELKAGVGIIRIKATAPIEQLSTNRHVLNLTNAHQPALSVYLVNALVPTDPAIHISKQMRDELQKNYRLEFSVTPRLP